MDSKEHERNPFENNHLRDHSMKRGDIHELSPQKPPIPSKPWAKSEHSELKLPPVKGYKLDSLGLGEAGETILK